MSVNGARRWPSLRAFAATSAALFTLTLAALPQSAGAATTTFTVDSTVHSNVATATADASTADGLCKTTSGACTLRAAIEQANALPASAVDDVVIDFADALGAATITLPSNGLRMQTVGATNNGATNDYLGNGFFFVVDAKRPVSIDLGDDIAIESGNDASNGIFLIKSPNVTVENFKNLRGGDSSIVVAKPAKNTTIRNGTCSDPTTIILETCIGLLSGSSDVEITDLTIESAWRFGIFVDRATAGDDPVSNIVVNDLKVTDTEAAGDIWFENNSKVKTFTIDGAEFNSPRVQAVRLQNDTVVEDLTISNAKFLGKDAYAIFTYVRSKTKNLTIEDSLFDGTNWAFVDYAGSTHDGLTLQRNTFNNTYQHVLDFVDSKLTNAVIAENDFTNTRVNGATTIWIGQPGTNNVIRDNNFTQAENVAAGGGSPAVPGYNNRWAIYNNAIPPTVNDDSGWAFRANHIDGYRSNSGGPIVNVGRGKTEMIENTFGPRTNGTVVPTESEIRSSNRFVTNRESDINKTIQTWRPTEATTDGTNLTIKVSPVTPTIGGNTIPTGPIAIDVFWTATDKAELFIGRLPVVDPGVGVVAGDAYVLPTGKTSGRFRVQTIDGNGNYSQYSAPMQVGAPTKAAPPTIVAVDASDDLTGTGEPGAEVNVTDEDGGTYGPVTVAADGTWTIPGGFDTCKTLTATQTNASNDASDTSSEFSTPACIGVPVISEINSDGAAVGTGEPGAEITLRDGNGDVVGTTTVGADSKWTVPGPIACGTTIVATQEKSGHVSVPSNSVPTGDCVDAPAILEITPAGDLSGAGLPNANVKVYDEDGNLVGETTADADGNWKLDGPLPCGKTLIARQSQDGSTISPDSTPVETGPCPPAPVIAAIDSAGNLDGTGQSGATVTVRDQNGHVVGTAVVRPNGTWDINGPLPCGSTLTATQADSNGNVSSVSAPMDTEACPSTPAPAAPVLTKVEDNGKVRGTGQPGATVKVYDEDGSLVGEALVKADGTWAIAGPVACGKTLSARQTDDVGKVSTLSGTLDTPACKADTKDTTAPAAPAITKVEANGRVRGSGEPGASVKVYDQDGNVVGEATVKADGTWTIAGPVACGQTLTAKQTDAAGNVSAISGGIKTAPCDTAKPAPAGPKSEDEIRLQCGAIPLALVDVRRGAKSTKTKRYGRTTIIGVADPSYVGKRVAIRYLGANKVVGRPTVKANGRFQITVADADQRDRTNANRRRYRAEIGSKRSADLKLTRRFRVTTVRSAGGSWTVRGSVSRPFNGKASVRVMVLNSCDDRGWTAVATGRLNANGRVSVKVPAPAAGSYQLVRMTTTVRQPSTRGKKGTVINTYTVPHGLR